MTTEYISTSKAAVNNMASLLFPEKEEVSSPDMNGETSKQSSESNSQHLLGNEEEKKADLMHELKHNKNVLMISNFNGTLSRY